MDYLTQDILRNISSILTPVGFETHPFLVGWYNEQVKDVFKLGYQNDTLAILIISTPSMYEKALKPFICRDQCTGIKDPIDECVAHHFEEVKKNFPDLEIECIHDFEMTPMRRPKILVQTAGHVAGAAYYYQKKDIDNPPWPEKQKICGVSIHPKYGGWFALRGVFILKNVHYQALERKSPIDIITDNQKKILLLERFNFHWKDWSFRDIIQSEQKYSEEQKLYFETPPAERWQLLGIERK
ncbi:unnamed protein product [Owenia fusiformis]|uniref:Cyanocobalamin reductase (cyanide-eliminating) n=1 Tax=Owenia fusiformis TaxID=6347 RepID=A0A8S4NQT9_OWEFU|nr:unnamed protein product [Owenia fusiformis]